ncbi:MAG: tRNA (adenosine(37)-N6)-threonylcarbamoyltransferase complex transferase subunit TsaD, partial [Elusimicrobiota bacterium]
KTAVVNYAHDSRFAIRGSRLSDLCASFQQSCVDVLIRKAVLACEKFNIKKIALGGGVSANSQLRADFIKKCDEENLKLFMPSVAFCTDNAAMIALAGYFKLKKIGGCKCVNPSANLELR